MKLEFDVAETSHLIPSHLNLSCLVLSSLFVISVLFRVYLLFLGLDQM